MTYAYELGAVRWKRHNGKKDVRAHRPPKGWEAIADVLEYHPVTGRPFRFSQWWIREVYTGN